MTNAPLPTTPSRWTWQDNWAPRHAPAFNAQLVERWFDTPLPNRAQHAWAALLDDPRWDPSCRWVPRRAPHVSCGWERTLLVAYDVPTDRWLDRLGERQRQRWPSVAGPQRPGLSETLLEVVSGDAEGHGWMDLPEAALERRLRLMRGLGPEALDQGVPDPEHPGWTVQPDPHRAGLLSRLAAFAPAHPLAQALLDMGATLAVRRPDGTTDADEWLDRIPRLPANDDVRTFWPPLLVRGLCTVPPGPEWATWKETARGGIVQRCVIEAAQRVEAQALRAVLQLPDLPAPVRSRL